MTFNMKYVQEKSHQKKVMQVIDNLDQIRSGAARPDAVDGDFMASMGAVVPSLMEQLRNLDRKGQEDPARVMSGVGWMEQIRSQADDSRSIFSARELSRTDTKDLGRRVAERTALLAGRTALAFDQLSDRDQAIIRLMARGESAMEAAGIARLEDSRIGDLLQEISGLQNLPESPRMTSALSGAPVDVGPPDGRERHPPNFEPASRLAELVRRAMAETPTNEHELRLALGRVKNPQLRDQLSEKFGVSPLFDGGDTSPGEKGWDVLTDGLSGLGRRFWQTLWDTPGARIGRTSVVSPPGVSLLDGDMAVDEPADTFPSYDERLAMGEGDDGVIDPAVRVRPPGTPDEDLRPGDVRQNSDGTETRVNEDGSVFDFGPEGELLGQTGEVLTSQGILQQLIELERFRLSTATGINPDMMGALYIDVYGDGETNPMKRMIERHTRDVMDRERGYQPTVEGQADPNDPRFDPMAFMETQEYAESRLAELGDIERERGTTTVWEFIESIDQMGYRELIEFQQALWHANYYPSFDVFKEDEPPWGERGNAFWGAVGNLVDDLAHDNSWSVERWLAERAAFVEQTKARTASGGGRGGGGGGGRVVVRLSDPTAIREAGNRFAQEEIGYELTDQDHADLVTFVHDLERQLAGMLQTGGDVTEIDVAARIRAWIAERYPEARSANRMNDAWSAIRAFIMQGVN